MLRAEVFLSGVLCALLLLLLLLVLLALLLLSAAPCSSYNNSPGSNDKYFVEESYAKSQVGELQRCTLQSQDGHQF